MKTSIKLLLGIAIAVLLTMVGTGWSFRQQYDQLDHSDPFAQFSRQKLPAFRVLKVIGSQGERFLLQPGASPVLRIHPEHQSEVTYKIAGDTLLIRYTLSYPDNDYNDLRAGDALQIRPTVVISAPAIQAVTVERATCKLANWQLANLTLAQTGPKGAFALENMIIGALQATMTGNSLLSAEAKNTIGQAKVTINGRASFIVGKTNFTSLQLRADSTATVQMPGALLAKIK